MVAVVAVVVVQLQTLPLPRMVEHQPRVKGFQVEIATLFLALAEVVRANLVVMVVLSLTEAAMEYRAPSLVQPCFMEVEVEDIILEPIMVVWVAAVVV
jgi:hypothetical protein